MVGKKKKKWTHVDQRKRKVDAIQIKRGAWRREREQGKIKGKPGEASTKGGAGTSCCWIIFSVFIVFMLGFGCPYRLIVSK